MRTVGKIGLLLCFLACANASLPPDLKALILKWIDTGADPCDNFYNFACGNFKHDWGPSGSFLPTFNGLMEQETKNLIHLLTRRPFSEDPVIGRAFQTCLATNVLKEEPPPVVLRNFTRLLNSLQSRSDCGKALGVLLRSGGESIWDIAISLTPLDEETEWDLKYWGVVVYPKFGIQYNFDDTADERQALAMVFDILGLINPLGKANSFFDNYVDYFSDIYKEYVSSACEQGAFLQEFNRGDFSREFENFPMEGLLQGFGDETFWGLNENSAAQITSMTVICPEVFRKVQAKYMSPDFVGALIMVNILKKSKNLLNSEFVSKLPKFIKNTKVSEIKPDIRVWQPNLPELPTPPFPFPKPSNTRRKIVGNVKGKEMEILCAQHVRHTYSRRVAQEWAKISQPDDTQKAVKDLVKDIYQALKQRLQSVSWIDAPTRAKALEKLRFLVQNVEFDPDPLTTTGYLSEDSHIFNLAASDAFQRKSPLLRVGTHFKRNSLNSFFDLYNEGMRDNEKQRWDTLVLNAFYMPNSNSINMLAGLILPPLYSSEFPLIIDLPSYGFIIGHEMTHGFDNSGRQYNGTGAKVNWWSPESLANFRRRIVCLVDQFNAYEVAPGVFINGVQTLGENIADLGGAGLAFRAYKTLPTEAELLPPYSNDQLFWIRAGQVWCGNASAHALIDQVRNDVHSPFKWRVNGPFSNIPEFAHSFNCSASSTMGKSLTAARCEVW
ncbi:hypothetical protein AAMO2058_000152200 [Amorphochlora amoebiformis]